MCKRAIQLTSYKQRHEGLSFEQKYISAFSIIVAFLSVIGGIFNLWAGFKPILYIFPFISTFIYMCFYLLSLNSKYTGIIKLLLTIYSIFFCNFFSFFNNGSHGPAIFMFLVFFILLIFIWDKKQFIWVSVFIFLNVLVFFYFEIENPEKIPPYDSDLLRSQDSLISILMYGVIVYLLVYIAKNNYLREYAKAQQADRLKSSFLENMSHEIRTPMNAIVGFSELIQRNKISDEKRISYANIIKDNSNQLLSLLSDILDVSKLEAKLVQVYMQDCNIDEFMKHVFVQFQKTITKNDLGEKIELIYKKHDTNFVFKTDTKRLLQIVGKLIDNSIKYTNNGSVEFGYEINEQNLITFYVKDTGIGINKDYHSLLFQSFNKFEADKKKELHRGTGIGLYMSRLLVELLGGRIWFTSEVNVGSTFYFSIPAGNIVHVVKERKPKLTVQKKWESYTILIVEDDDTSFVYLKELLEVTGIKIVRVEDGADAQEKIKSSYNAILMDVNIPGANGYDLIKQIREKDSQVPIIVQTSYVYLDIPAELRATFDYYLPKPVESAKLMEILEKNLENKLR